MSWHCWICGSPEDKPFVRMIVKEDFHPKNIRYNPRVLKSGVVHADCLRMVMRYGQKKRMFGGWLDDFEFLKINKEEVSE